MSRPVVTTTNHQNTKAFAVIGTISALVLAFLVWLIYVKEGAATHAHWATWLPALNSILNATTTILLILGYRAVKNKNIQVHIRYMMSAVVTSGLFLVSYILYHHFQGDTKFLATGFVRPVYFFILISHIVLSIPLVPMVFTTLYFALTKQVEKHKKIAKKTFPIWLYVSVTGVLIYIFLKLFNTAQTL